MGVARPIPPQKTGLVDLTIFGVGNQNAECGASTRERAPFDYGLRTWSAQEVFVLASLRGKWGREGKEVPKVGKNRAKTKGRG